TMEQCDALRRRDHLRLTDWERSPPSFSRNLLRAGHSRVRANRQPKGADWGRGHKQLIDWPIWLARRLSAAAANGLGSVPEVLGSGQAGASNFNHRATNMFISGTTRSRV